MESNDSPEIPDGGGGHQTSPASLRRSTAGQAKDCWTFFGKASGFSQPTLEAKDGAFGSHTPNVARCFLWHDGASALLGAAVAPLLTSTL